MCKIDAAGIFNVHFMHPQFFRSLKNLITFVDTMVER